MSIHTGEKTVPIGAAEQIVTNKPGKSIAIKALWTNTAIVYVGGLDVTLANGYPLAAGESLDISPIQEGELFCVSGTAAQKLRWAVAP